MVSQLSCRDYVGEAKQCQPATPWPDPLSGTTCPVVEPRVGQGEEKTVGVAWPETPSTIWQQQEPGGKLQNGGALRAKNPRGSTTRPPGEHKSAHPAASTSRPLASASPGYGHGLHHGQATAPRHSCRARALRGSRSVRAARPPQPNGRGPELCGRSRGQQRAR